MCVYAGSRKNRLTSFVIIIIIIIIITHTVFARISKGKYILSMRTHRILTNNVTN